jgi:molybdopterin/thiamine biosynthesis adenylyltransferase
MEQLRDASILVCGAGALGANLVESLARMGCDALAVIDFDRVEERNLSTQPYGRRDVGASKVRMLANDVYRAVGTDLEAIDDELAGDNVDELLSGYDWLVDCFDNSESRGLVTRWCRRTDTPGLHVGVADGYGECVWNGDYEVPSEARDDVCDYPLTRSLVLVMVGIACEILVDAIVEDRRRHASLTLGDLELHTLPN